MTHSNHNKTRRSGFSRDHRRSMSTGAFIAAEAAPTNIKQTSLHPPVGAASAAINTPATPKTGGHTMNILSRISYLLTLLLLPLFSTMLAAAPETNEQQRLKEKTVTHTALQPLKKEQPQTAPVYKPPKRGAPSARVGGGTRGIDGQNISLYVLSPSDTGRTSNPQPVLYWYLSHKAETRFEFALIDDQQIQPILEKQLTQGTQAGIGSLQLSDYDITLKPGVQYRWSLALVTDPKQRSKDTLASGMIEYVAPSSELQQQLSKADSQQRVHLLAENGFWYDSFAELSQLIDSKQSEQFRGQRAALLEQVGLTEVATYAQQM